MVAWEELIDVQVMWMRVSGKYNGSSCFAEPLHVSHKVSPHVYEECVRTPTPHDKIRVL